MTTHKTDWPLIFTVIFLLFFGAIMVFNASYAESYRQFNDPYRFGKLQLLWVLGGSLVAFILSLIPLSLFKKMSRFLFIGTLLLLILILVPGVAPVINGAKRWLFLGPLGLQPAELMKLAVILYFPSWLLKTRSLLRLLLLSGLIIGLIILQPDMGTALVLTTVIFSLVFIANYPVIKIISLIIFGVLVGAILIFTSPYRMARVSTFLNPLNDPLGKSYQIRQILLSIGSGGLWGSGVGLSRAKYQYLPESSTDAIFAVIAEETGLWGTLLVIFAYIYLFIRGLLLSNKLEDPYSRLVANGIIIWITVQAFINLSAIVALIPFTGVPLPFISYGGSSLTTIMIGIGLFFSAQRFGKQV
jgi:cell division protein FtsW